MSNNDAESKQFNQAEHLLETNEQIKTVSAFWRQLFAAAPPIILSISAGMIYGYSATLIPELQKPESDIQVTLEIASWVASAVPLLMSINCLLGGPIMERYGRKKAFLIVSIPTFIGWITISLAPNLTAIIIGRVLGGIGTGFLAPLFPTYLGEISSPKYRGFFLSTPSIALTFGILITHIMGTFLNWRLVAFFAAVFPLLAMFALYFVPETPHWLLRQERFIDASKSFNWLRGKGVINSPEFQQMIQNQKESANKITSDRIHRKLISSFKRPEFVKPFGILFCCFFIAQFSGFYMIAFYSVNILEKTLGTTMNKYVVMNAIDAVRLVMVLIGGFFLRVSRRRVVMYVSGVGATISLLSLTSFLYGARQIPELQDLAWIAVLMLVAYIFFISIGIFLLPWCMVGELYPIDCRGFGSSLSTSINYFLFFLVIKTGPTIFENIGMDGMFLFYGGICLFGTIVLGFVLPETKNKTLVDIEMYFTKTKPNPSDEKTDS